MKFRQQMLWSRGVLLIALGCTAASSALAAGDAIRFSRPAVPIAAPAAEHDLPDTRDRLKFSELDFQPDIAPPPVRPPPPVMRREPRDERDSVPRIFQTPKIFTDPDEEKARKEAADNPLAAAREKNRPNSPFANDPLGQSRLDQARALTPERRFDWDPRDSASRQRDFEQRNDRDRTERARQSFASREDDDRLNSMAVRAVPTYDFSSGREKQKDKLTPSQMKLRADFEQLLNPTAGAAAKAPNSLQPVVSAANAKPGSLAVPTVGNSEMEPRDPRLGDPMANLNRQHERLRGPALEDINKRYNSPAATPSGSAADSRNQSILNREPLRREFPSRKF